MQQTTKRTIVDIDTRRTIVMVARARKPQDVAKETHEQFVRNALKDRMGWPRREPAPEAIKVAAREIAAQLKARDKALADAKFAAKQAADAKSAKAAAELAEAEAQIAAGTFGEVQA